MRKTKRSEHFIFFLVDMWAHPAMQCIECKAVRIEEITLVLGLKALLHFLKRNGQSHLPWESRMELILGLGGGAGAP